MKFLFLAIAFFFTSLAADRSLQEVVENGLYTDEEPDVSHSIIDRMRDLKIPGVSIAVINKGKLAWSAGYGTLTSADDSTAVNSKTLFQAGSISQSLTAFGVMILVQQGKLDLDKDVNVYLKRWKVPENTFTQIAKVTLRKLLSHTAGTSVPGFTGYESQAPLPDLVTIVQGKKPANSKPIKVEAVPGTSVSFSGGGSAIAQLVIEDVTNEPFALWMYKNVFMPLKMNDSTFIQPLPPALALNAAHGYKKNGDPVKGNWYNYPEQGSRGLWTTPEDLAKFIIYIEAALKGEVSDPLEKKYVEKMIHNQRIGARNTDKGLGFSLINSGEDLSFTLIGQNEGFISRIRGVAYQGKGYAIMMNNDDGWPLLNEIRNSIRRAYHWPEDPR